ETHAADTHGHARPTRACPFFCAQEGVVWREGSLSRRGDDPAERSDTMGKLISMKQREANRRNAERSTGPKTGAAKSIVKWNALKHGLLASAVVLRQEDRAEYERLWARLVESLQPVGTLEALLVEDIAAICWRRRRAGRAEAANIEWDTTDARGKMHSIQAKIQKTEAERDIDKLQGSVAGLERLGEVFDGMARELRHDGSSQRRVSPGSRPAGSGVKRTSTRCAVRRRSQKPPKRNCSKSLLNSSLRLKRNSAGRKRW